ncbi:MAG: hypothetical protein WCA77_02860 [Thermoplasmata archaeon]
MAKKVRKKPDEEAEFRNFQFPEFDEAKFYRHEFDQTYATVAAIAVALLLGVVSYLVDTVGFLLFVPPILGIAGVAFSPWLIQRVHVPQTPFTKGEWAGLFLLEIFGWLGVWFLLLNVFPT